MSMSEQERQKIIKETFNTVAEGYDSAALRFFATSARLQAACFGFKGNERVLDVATGTGNVALILAQAVSQGHVTGIDFSAEMLNQARLKAHAQNLSNVDFVEMDMQAMSFPNGHFDAAASAFGIFFVDDMQKQLSHITSKVRSGGKVCISTFYDNAFSPLVDIFITDIQAFGVEQPPLAWKRVSSESQCVALFKSTGFRDILVTRSDVGYYLRDAQEWWDIIWYAGFRSLVNRLSERDRNEFKAKHLHHVSELATEKGIRLDVEVLHTLGVKP